MISGLECSPFSADHFKLLLNLEQTKISAFGKLFHKPCVSAIFIDGSRRSLVTDDELPVPLFYASVKCLCSKLIEVMFCYTSGGSIAQR